MAGGRTSADRRGDRNLYSIETMGTVQLEGLLCRQATASAEQRTWRFRREGFWQPTIVATDGSGSQVGEFRPRSLRRGGLLRWEGRELVLRALGLGERYALLDGDTEL